jgi:hypothetical protein
MIRTGQWEQQEESAVKELMRHLQGALRAASFTDENGERVRKFHAIPTGENQGRLWDLMERISRDDMHASLQSRSGGAYGIIKQINRDQNYFNKHHNPGDKIQLSFNYDQRLEDEKHSSEYVDEPPPEEKED